MLGEDFVDRDRSDPGNVGDDFLRCTVVDQVQNDRVAFSDQFFDPLSGLGKPQHHGVQFRKPVHYPSINEGLRLILQDVLTASVLSPVLSLPIAKYDYPWDGRLARERVLDWCKSKIGASPTTKEIEASCAKRAFLLQRDGEPEYTREAWDLPYADVIGGSLHIVPRGVKALASGHGVGAVQDISEGDRRTLERHVCSLYAKVRGKHVEMPPCPFDKKEDKKMTGSLEYSRTAAGVPVIRQVAPVAPPIEWFAPMETDAPMPLTIQSDGRVMGHGALWDSCHAGFADRCVPVPHSAQDYRFFHRGAVKTEDGSLVAVGHLTVGSGHADPNGNLVAATEHYDDATSTVAVVSAHEDRWGIYLAGSAVPEATPQQIAMLLRSPLSGDWREFNGNLELVAMHGVNVPGFGVDRPRQAVSASGSLIFPGPYAEVEEAAPEPSAEEIDSRISLAASLLFETEGE